MQPGYVPINLDFLTQGASIKTQLVASFCQHSLCELIGDSNVGGKNSQKSVPYSQQSQKSFSKRQLCYVTHQIMMHKNHKAQVGISSILPSWELLPLDLLRQSQCRQQVKTSLIITHIHQLRTIIYKFPNTNRRLYIYQMQSRCRDEQMTSSLDRHLHHCYFLRQQQRGRCSPLLSPPLRQQQRQS